VGVLLVLAQVVPGLLLYPQMFPLPLHEIGVGGGRGGDEDDAEPAEDQAVHEARSLPAFAFADNRGDDRGGDCPDEDEQDVEWGNYYRPTWATAYAACASVNPLPEVDVSCSISEARLNPPICMYPLAASTACAFQSGLR